MARALVDGTRVPQARVVYDRFHVERLAADAVDEVRRTEQRRLGKTSGKTLKRTRYARRPVCAALRELEFARGRAIPLDAATCRPRTADGRRYRLGKRKSL